MPTIPLNERIVTRLDFVRVSRAARPNPPLELKECLANADLVASTDVPNDVITMNSSFVIADGNSGESRKLTLCYPEDTNPSDGCISVLSPVGASLLGLREGESAVWVTPQGHLQTATVMQLLFQPEAAGDFTL